MEYGKSTIYITNFSIEFAISQAFVLKPLYKTDSYDIIYKTTYKERIYEK